jgi:spermidine synthase
MTSPLAPAPAAAPLSPLVLLLFAGSGCAALIYEVVWFHLLRLVVGSSAVSLGFLLGSFMGGMCLGSWLVPRLTPRRWHPLVVYALLELGIGALGLTFPHLLPWLGREYIERAGPGAQDLIWRGLLCAALLLPPTALMGATLPAIARWLDTSRQGFAALGRFYGANIVGAVAGTLLAGFWLLRVFDVEVASWVAAAFNLLVALVALALARRAPFVPPAVALESELPPARGRWLVYLAIAISGLCALGCEVVWTRLLALLFGASVYAFSLILAVFLVGLGLGTAVGSQLAGRSARPQVWFGLCQLLVVPALLYTMWMIGQVIPFLDLQFDGRSLSAHGMTARFVWDALRGALAILPAPLLWGASFPLALAAAGSGARDNGRLVGGLYAGNTIGAIAGALVASLGVVWLGGSQRTLQLLALLAAVAGALLLVVAPLPPSGRFGGGRIAAIALGLGALAALPIALPRMPKVPSGLIASGRTIGDWDYGVDYLYVAEGVNSSVAVSETRDDGVLSFHVAGKVEASTVRIDMRLQRMLGHLPAIVHGKPRSVLIVGCGAGVTAGSFVDHPSVERIVLCEIEPKVVEGSRKYFAPENRGVLDDQRTQIVFDDARHFLLTTKEKFDVITSDPIHPWVRGAATLYTKEYLELVKQHLNPGGVVTQWVPLYETDEASVKSQVGTFFHAFPEGNIWSSDLEQHGYDVVLMAQAEAMHVDVDRVERYLEETRTVRAALVEVDLGDAVRLLSTFAGRASDLAPWLADAQLNEDRSLRLQYLAGLAFDQYRDGAIYGAMKQHLRFPEGLFQASPLFDGELRKAFAK